MAENIEDNVTGTENSGTDTSSSTEIDWKEVADAEKARADAAEALIVKHKNLEKRNAGLTEDRVKELITEAVKPKEDEAAQKVLTEAQEKVKELERKNAELARAANARDAASGGDVSATRDGLEAPPNTELPKSSPLAGYTFNRDTGEYTKKLESGAIMWVRVHPVTKKRTSGVRN